MTTTSRFRGQILGPRGPGLTSADLATIEGKVDEANEGADLSRKWADSTGEEPGGAGTKSAKEHAASAMSAYANAQLVAEDLGAIGEAILTPAADPGNLLAIGDEEGRAAFVLKEDGTIENAHIERIEQRLAERAGEALFAVGDTEGRAAFVLREDGTIENADIDALKEAVASGPSSASPITAEQVLGQMLHFLIYGQSLSIGLHATPLRSTTALTYAKMFSGHVRPWDTGSGTRYASLANLVENTGSGDLGETIASGMATTIKYLLERDLGVDIAASGWTPLFSAPGESDKLASELANGSTYFTRLKEDITAGQTLSAAASKVYQTLAMPYLQGEAERGLGASANATTWKTNVAGIRSDAQAWAASTTGYAYNLPMIIYQLPHAVALMGTAEPIISLAALDLIDEQPMIGCIGPTYFLDFVDTAHLSADNTFYLGRHFGLAAYEWTFKANKPMPMEPDVAWLPDGAVLTFPTAVGQLVLDTTRIVDPGSYGFQFRSGADAAIAVSSVTVVGRNKIILRAATALPSGSVLRYGYYNGGGATTTAGRLTGCRGCVRDSRGEAYVDDPLKSTMPLHQWMPLIRKVKP